MAVGKGRGLRLLGAVLLFGLSLVLLGVPERAGVGNVATLFAVLPLVLGYVAQLYWSRPLAAKKAARKPAAGSPAGTVAETPPATVELPLPPEIPDLIGKLLAAYRRKSWVQSATTLAVMGGVFLIPLIVGWLAGKVDPPLFHFMLKVLAVVAVFTLFMTHLMESPELQALNRDRRGATCLRTSGPVELVVIQWNTLRMLDHAFSVNDRVARAVAGRAWASVDYTPHAHLVLAVRDQDGNLLYQLTESDPLPAPIDTGQRSFHLER